MNFLNCLAQKQPNQMICKRKIAVNNEGGLALRKCLLLMLKAKVFYRDKHADRILKIDFKKLGACLKAFNQLNGEYSLSAYHPSFVQMRALEIRAWMRC